ncbi:unnamed protein product [Paramecium pentaurelia]|uniref:Uncharacterized protein n=1 Tax=Paramecium pentaurelia TaxID=43138 RepID=A0A8S1VCU1_9CILI|nr:unnamed protein product [Paramecium pentaurelia]
MSQGHLIIMIKPLNQNLNIEMDPDTQVKELFEYIQNEFKIASDIRNWTCYSEQKRIYLDHQGCIGKVQNEKLTINTQPNEQLQQITPDSNLIKASSQLQYTQNQQAFPAQVQQQQIQIQPLNQSSQQIQNKLQSGNQPQQQNYNQAQLQNSSQVQNQSQTVNINFIITDGNIKRQFQSIFNSNDKLENLADAVLAYLGVTKEIASCDLIIFDQNYNHPTKREKTLHQLSIKSEVTVDARLRWIGGSQY